MLFENWIIWFTFLYDHLEATKESTLFKWIKGGQNFLHKQFFVYMYNKITSCIKWFRKDFKNSENHVFKIRFVLLQLEERKAILKKLFDRYLKKTQESRGMIDDDYIEFSVLQRLHMSMVVSIKLIPKRPWS